MTETPCSITDSLPFLERANHAMSTEQYAQAIEDLTVAITINPYATLPFLQRSYAHLQIGNYTKYLEDYQKFVSLSNNGEENSSHTLMYKMSSNNHSNLSKCVYVPIEQNDDDDDDDEYFNNDDLWEGFDDGWDHPYIIIYFDSKRPLPSRLVIHNSWKTGLHIENLPPNTPIQYGNLETKLPTFIYIDRKGEKNYILYEKIAIDAKDFFSKDRPSLSELASEFAPAFAKGLFKGFRSSASSFAGLLADMATKPIQTAKSVYEGISALAKLTKARDWETIGKSLSPELHDLATKWDTLSSKEKGELAGLALGKIGSDILLPGAVAKGAATSLTKLKTAIRSLQNTERLLTAESFAQIKDTAELAKIFENTKQTITLSEELGLLPQEVNTLKTAGTLESTLKTKSGHVFDNPTLHESYTRFTQAQEELKPFTKTILPESQVRDLIHQQGIETFPRPYGVTEEFQTMVSNQGAGMVYVHPTDPSTTVRVMPEKPHSVNPWQHEPYVIHRKSDDFFDKLGNIVEKGSEAAHIPLQEFVFIE